MTLPQTTSSGIVLVKPQYIVNYNPSKNTANWVSWHLDASWLGSVDRTDDFRPDPQLSSGVYQVKPTEYTNTGFDRGHLCPSADRTNTTVNNSSTFLMTNIVPQSPGLNRGAWSLVEDYCRRAMSSGYEVYIISGVYGSGGNGSNGQREQIGNNITVPERLWKVAIFLRNGTSDLSRINTATEVLTVDMPNTEAVTGISWTKHITTLGELEAKIGTSLTSQISSSVATYLRSKKFDLDTTSLPNEVSVNYYNGHYLIRGPKGGCYYINSNGNKTYVDRSLCD